VIQLHPVILVVEDEPIILLATADDLRDVGFTVYEASNADAALRALDSHPNITVVFTDIDMPGSMSGLRLSFAVHERWPPMKIIITSGMKNLAGDLMPAGGVFLSKPYSTLSLIETIKALHT
jgi:DNA-binding NtrC family response regulator